MDTTEQLETDMNPTTEIIEPMVLEWVVPNYEYWENQNTLDYNVALRNKKGGNFKILRLTRALNNTWSLSISTIGFTPKMIRIQAFKQTPNTWDFSDCTWVLNWGTLTTYWMNNTVNWWFASWTNAWNIIQFVDAVWSSCTATLTSLDDNWFTINFSTVNFTIEFNAIVTW